MTTSPLADRRAIFSRDLLIAATRNRDFVTRMAPPRPPLAIPNRPNRVTYADLQMRQIVRQIHREHCERISPRQRIPSLVSSGDKGEGRGQMKMCRSNDDFAAGSRCYNGNFANIGRLNFEIVAIISRRNLVKKFLSLRGRKISFNEIGIAALECSIYLSI